MAANVRFSNPKTLAKPPGILMSSRRDRPNRLIFIAGLLGLDMENRLVGEPGDFRAQANKAVENLKLALADAGATLRDVVKINNYLVDMSHIAIFREVRDAHFNMSAPPASTTVAISQLARPGAFLKSRRSRCCRRKGPGRPRRHLQSVADLQRRAEKSENSSPIMGKTPAGRRRAGAMRIPWWAWAWPAGAWLILLLTPFLQVRGFVAAVAGAALIATVFAAVYHAEVVAHRTGERLARSCWRSR